MIISKHVNIRQPTLLLQIRGWLYDLHVHAGQLKLRIKISPHIPDTALGTVLIKIYAALSLQLLPSRDCNAILLSAMELARYA